MYTRLNENIFCKFDSMVIDKISIISVYRNEMTISIENTKFQIGKILQEKWKLISVWHWRYIAYLFESHSCEYKEASNSCGWRSRIIIDETEKKVIGVCRKLAPGE